MCRARGLGAILTDFCYSMDHKKGEKSGEMYSPDEQGEYRTAMQASSFTVQGLRDALTTLDPQVTEVMKCYCLRGNLSPVSCLPYSAVC